MSERPPRYIDAKKLCEFRKVEIKTNGYAANYVFGWNEAISKIEKEAPTEDVTPVIHGRWRLEEETFSCSNCNAIFFCGFNTKRENEIRLKDCYKFCPVCGAKMEVEDNND